MLLVETDDSGLLSARDFANRQPRGRFVAADFQRTGATMRRSKTLERLRSGDTVRMCSLGHFIPHFVKHAAQFGFDCIWLDLEHRAMSDAEVLSLLAFSHLFDVDVMVRPPTLEKTRLYRYLEDGAAGIMIPHVSTPEKAKTLVDAVKFPPIGDRGLDGAGLDSDFLHRAGPAYPDEANRETFLVVQIETPQAIDNVDAIAAVEGVDGLFVGPADLALRYRHSSGGRTLEGAFERVAEACARHGKAWGCPVASADDLARKQSQGGRLLAYGGEFMAIMTALRECAAVFEKNPISASSDTRIV
jgi:2-keto-3-deoxy-L-rhamnonate aldolase RhmA